MVEQTSASALVLTYQEEEQYSGSTVVEESYYLI